MKEKHLPVIILLLIAATLTVLGDLYIRHTRNNMENRYGVHYFVAAGVDYLTPFEELVRQHGEPKNIIFLEHAPHLAVVQFDEFEVVVPYWRDSSTLGRVQSVRITGSSIRFGEYQIGVGSTREEIELAYRKMVIHESPDGTITVIEGRTWVVIRFDENDKVERITLTVDGS